ncbi:hypothetical protein BO70DRAFT_366335 [Aspergillus heteromorphus CBS 117.55]|uniref:Uncharacterized protein n=1 Tax=Aspergillus heteromorphus CBS 117.55 TaxID=1448321 RepID=A0A317V2U2_9EURO|nr:uncharacterized protein BO70DRAFT_366335 [Aspergillus heteromorphus CBS 117.55]PWY67157.1 hypothetical protein BO70DRAFT_366335 [Aspergillus heteromorphus CBS 117.55]
MPEGMRDERGGRPPATTVPAIITSNVDDHHHHHHREDSNSNNSPYSPSPQSLHHRGDYSPTSPIPGLLRSSQNLPPAGSVSDLASASVSSGNPPPPTKRDSRDSRTSRTSRPLPIQSNGSVKNLASSPTFFHHASADSSAIDPLSQVRPSLRPRPLRGPVASRSTDR